MDDILCPYCGEEQQIDHDDGYGYAEDELYTQECRDCNKIFIYKTSITYYYEGMIAPCLNGGKHDWEQMVGAPREYFIGKFRCTYCDEEESRDEKGRQKALNKMLEK